MPIYLCVLQSASIKFAAAAVLHSVRNCSNIFASRTVHTLSVDSYQVNNMSVHGTGGGVDAVKVQPCLGLNVAGLSVSKASL